MSILPLGVIRMGTFRFAIAALAIAQVSLGACRPREKSAAATAPSDRAVLATFPAGSAGRTYELSVATCVATSCPVQVRLLDGASVLDTLSLDWPLPSDKVDETSLDRMSGVGDPLDVSLQQQAWSAGAGEGTVRVAARTIALADDLNGLLAHEVAGFDHVKRRHFLVVAERNKLRRAWIGTEGQGPYWSAVAVSGDDGKVQQLVYYRGFHNAAADQVDDLQVTRYTWGGEGRGLVEQSGPDGLSGVFLGPYRSVAAARQVQAQHAACLGDYWVLRSELFDVTSGPVVLAAVTATDTLATAARRATQECWPQARLSTGKLKLTPTAKE